MDRFRMLPNYQYHDDDTGILETQYKKEMRNYQIYGNSIQGSLPSEYQEVEYIESSGVQLIDTLVTPSSNIDLEITAQGLNTALENGASDNWATNALQLCFFGASNKIRAIYGNIGVYDFDIDVNSQFNKARINGNGEFYINDNLVYSFKADEFEGSNTICLFGCRYPNVVKTSGRIKNAKIYRNGVLIRNFIPCYRKSDNVIGMYDLISNKFFVEVSGGGAFIKGNNVSDILSPDNPIEIQSVGEKTKNLFDKNNFTKLVNIIPNASTLGFYSNSNSLYIPIEGGKTYTVSGAKFSRFVVCTTVDEPAASVLISNRVDLGAITPSKEIKSLTITADATANYLVVRYHNANTDTYTEQDILDTLQIELSFGKYKIPIEVSGKNLFDINQIINIGKVINNGDGSITVSGYPSATGKFLYQLCPSMKIGQTVTFSMVTTGYHQIYLHNISNGSTRLITNNTSFIVTEDILNSELNFYRNSNGDNATISNIQFEEGTEVTPYEPYQEPQTYNIFLDEPLRKIGNYADYIDFKNGKVVRYIRTLNVKSGTSCNRHTIESTGVSYFQLNGLNTGWQGLVLAPIYKQANIYSFLYNKNPTNNTIAIGSWGSWDSVMTIRDDRFTDIASFKEGIKDIKFYAANSTPIETTIELPKIQLNKGTNIIKVKTAIQPYKVNWQYYK